jgi:serine/threonine protein kinase/tetratricopeptide (TPR) repeat protein
MNEESLFAAALEKVTDAERRAFLDQACAGDDCLRQRMERLLAAQAQSGGILDRPAPGTAATAASSAPGGMSPEERVGALVAGRYKLLEEIGEGGMGTVWVAEQTQPVRRKVAVKLVKAGMDTKAVLARFEAERQALALMDHPNIAKVLDGGTTGGEPGGVSPGRPYFVMEYVKGVPLTAYCDDARLSIAQRLALFVPVCKAVQHAHQKGVIHRDLKPSNILVCLYDGQPVPKVIDFGLAKAMHQPLTERTLHTAHGAMMGTPLYMSPEQAEFNNLDVDTRTDVYALGVILYELLTGTTPLERQRFQQAAWHEMLRLIKEEEPPRPSARLSGSGSSPSVAAQRQMEPVRLAKLVRGELDWIVMKALEKDRNRRYETANGFAMDVQRYLAHEPVLACPPSVGYLLRKFVRRNRGTVVGAALVAGALLAGIVGTTVGLVQAERRAEGERRAKETAEKRLAQIEKGIGVLGSIFENLDPMAEEKEGRPLRVILGDRLDQAAAELEGEAVGDPLVVAQLQDRLGQTYLGLGQGARAEALLAKAAASRRAHLGADDPLTLGSMHNLAVACAAAGKRDEAIRLFDEVRAARALALGPDHADTLASLNGLAFEYWRSGKLTEAVPLLEQVRDGRVQLLGEDHDDTLTTLGLLAEVYLAARRRAEAVALAEKVWHTRVQKHGDDHPQAIAAMSHLAYIYQGSYKMRPALALLEQARDKTVPKLGPYHPLTFDILRNLGRMYRVYRRTPEATALLEQVRDRQQMVLGGQHPNTLTTLWDLTMAYRDAGDLNKALALAQQAAAGVERLQFKHSYADYIFNSLALCLEDLKQFDQAVAWRRKCLPFVERKHGKESVDYAEELIRIGSDLIQLKKPADAEPGLRQALAILDKQPDAGEKLFAQSVLGAALAELGRYGEAEPLLLEAYRGMKNFAAEHKGQGALPSRRQSDALQRLVQVYDAWEKPAEAGKWRKELDEYAKAAEPAVKPGDK